MKRIYIILLCAIVLVWNTNVPAYAEGNDSDTLISVPQAGQTPLNGGSLSGSNDSVNEYVPVPELGGGYEGTYNYFYSSNYAQAANCYGYALGINAWVAPGYDCGANLSGYQNNYSNDSTNISNLCSAVIGDLMLHGYINAHEVSASYIPSSYETKIAFRVGYYTSTNQYRDVHFMKWSPSGYWLHKPGTSAIIRYKYTSLTSTWYPEGYFISSGWAHDNTFTYKGTVKYVVY